jgi:3'-5' exoribonuclease
MKKRFVRDIRAGDAVDDLFVLSEKVLSRKKDGSPFLSVCLSDRTGILKGVVWDADEATSRIASGDPVHVRGTANLYKEALQLVIRQMEPSPAESVDPLDFLPATTRSIESMFERLCGITSAMDDRHLKSLFDLFWSDPELVAGFKRSPAAKRMHHAYIGGLLEHTLSMALLAERVAGHYGGVDRELLLSGVILHDIGKVRELGCRLSIDYTDEGRLLSHIVIGLGMLDEKLARIPDFPAERAMLLRHLIVSHHGSMEFGSPEPPKTIEAVLLNFIDEIDSKVNGIREFVASESCGEPWTPYHRILGRHFYVGKSGGA